jgi:hypothetical protein
MWDRKKEVRSVRNDFIVYPNRSHLIHTGIDQVSHSKIAWQTAITLETYHQRNTEISIPTRLDGTAICRIESRYKSS